MMTLVKCPVKCHQGTCWLPAGHDTVGGTGFRWCVSPRSLYCNVVTIFPFPLSVRRVTKPFPHSDGVGENIFLPEVGRVSAILGNSSVRMILFLLSHLFLYSVIYQHVLMEIYFILRVPNQCLFCCSDCSRSGLWERFQVGCCVFWTCQLFFFFFSSSLLFGVKRHSRLILLFPYVSTRIKSFLHRVLLHFFGEWLGLLDATHVSLLLDPLSGQNQEMYVCVHTKPFMHASICFLMYKY